MALLCCYNFVKLPKKVEKERTLIQKAVGCVCRFQPFHVTLQLILKYVLSQNRETMLNLDEFYRARFVLGKILRRTELVRAPKLNPESEIYLKPENLQITGSFKIRGAYYKISQLSEEEKARGVVACSAGNHAQGVALGATSHGIKSLICLPE